MFRTRKPEARGRQHTPALERHPSQEGIIANTLPAGRAKSPLERGARQGGVCESQVFDIADF